VSSKEPVQGPMGPRVAQSDLERVRHKLVQMHSAARVGHAGGNLSCIDSILLLYREVMAVNDLFVLSKGHSAGALYTVLAELGVLGESLGAFHGEGTRLSGHPAPFTLAQAPFATGSLGHGVSIACGLAKAVQLGAKARQIYCLTSDGEWQEGSCWEALIFAAHHKLSSLTLMVDRNGWQGFGRTGDISSLTDFERKFGAFDVEIQIADGHDLDQMRKAFEGRSSRRANVIILDTVKGRGLIDSEDTLDSHYRPPSGRELEGFVERSTHA
jgi:transketolase